MLDLRLPTGLFFAIVGVLLMVHGIIVPANVNLDVGGVMAAFGITMLLLARRGRKE